MRLLFTSLTIIGLCLSALLWTACETEESCFGQDEISGIIEMNYDVGACFQVMQDSQYVIDDNIDYQNLRLEMDSAFLSQNAQCDTAVLLNPDFEHYTLLGVYAQGQGCTAAFKRNVEVDAAGKKYIYTVKVQECGRCTTIKPSMNWVLVPKKPDDYEVEFFVEIL